MADYQCPCGCGLDVNVNRCCCTQAYNRLPVRLRRRVESTYSLALAHPAGRRRAFAEVADWLRDNPPARGASGG